MIRDGLAALVVWCWRNHLVVMGVWLVLTIWAGIFAATHLDMDADESKLLAADLPFKKAEGRMDRAFPDAYNDLVIVIDGPNPGQVMAAAGQLQRVLAAKSDVFAGVRLPAGTNYFQHNGLLYLSLDELQALSDKLTMAQPVLGALARDPSTRGLAQLLAMMAQGVAQKQAAPSEVDPVLSYTSTYIEGVMRNAPPQKLNMPGVNASVIPNRAFVMARPVLDFSDITPGQEAAKAVRKAAAQLGLDAAHGFTIRLTGPVALTDDNFATVVSGMDRTGILSTLAVLGLLALAVRAKRLVGVVLLTLVAGLVTTAAFAAATVGTLNPISVAFAVMFIGIAVDFAIQFIVRYQDFRQHAKDSRQAITATAAAMVMPLSLAALASASGFLSFIPTNYQGVSQLGLIAGGGMILALIVDLTLLPALLRLVRPRGHREMAGIPLSGPMDDLMARFPKVIVGLAVALGLVGVVLLPRLSFDTNTLHLQNPKAESVSTLMELARNPDTSPYSIDLLAADDAQATDIARQLSAMPQVDHAVTLNSFVPDDQDQKMAIIADVADLYGPVLAPQARLPEPEVFATQTALRQAILNLDTIATASSEAGHLQKILEQVVKSEDLIDRLNHRLQEQVIPNITLLSQLLEPSAVTQVDLPPDLVGDWVSVDNQRKVSVWPKENMNDPAAMADFVHVVKSIDPMATGMPASMVEAGSVVTGAFLQAVLWSLVAIGLLLGLTLRRVLDSLLVLLPLVLGGLYTVLACVALHLAINFANIIALPLLLGIGVAFNIYFVVNWRAGVRDHWGTATGRAVLYSALTTSSAFGSLAVSPHVGTASMGLLLFLSVGVTVATTFLVLPALLHLVTEPEA